MAEFRYEQYQPRYTNSIAALMERAGEIPAQAAQQIGQAQAGAAIGRGNAWAGAAQNIGQTVQGAIQQATDPRRKLEQQQFQIGAEELAARKRAAMLNGQVNQLLSSAMTQNDDGTVTFDRGKLRQGFSATNVPIALQEQTFKSLDEVDKSLQAFNQVRVDHLADLAHATLMNPHGATPETFAFTAALAKANGLITDKQLAPVIDAIAQGGDIKALLTSVRGMSEKYKDAAKPIVVPRGGTVMSPTGEIIGKGQEIPKTPAQLALEASGGDPGTALTLLHPQQSKALQSKSVLLDGKPAEVSYNPADGSYQVNGQVIESSRITPIPPASVTIRNMNAQPINLPAWALDDTRPTGPEANKLDPVTKMTPNGLFQAAQNYIATGQYPQTGRGSDPQSQATRAAVNAKVGAIVAASGMDEPALRAFYKSNAASLAQQQKMYDSVQGFMATADKNAALLEQSLKGIPDTGSPLFNKPLRAFMKDIAGDANLSQAATYMQSVQNEYARIIAQPNLAGQLTDSARHEAQLLLDPKATVPQILASIQALKNEGDNRLVSVGEQIQRIQKRISGGPQTGIERWERGPDGKLRKVGG